MKSKKGKIRSKGLSFEKALKRLEEIVEALEEGDLDLEDALRRYEEGVRLARFCEGKLREVEQRVEVLRKTFDGGFQKEPFQEEDTANPDFDEPPLMAPEEKSSNRQAEEENF